MSYNCKILLDSISPTGKRLTTFEITFPRIVLAEFNTHRMLSRNSASSRAIPFEKQLEKISSDPFIPEKFPINTKGMQPVKYVDQFDNNSLAYFHARSIWLNALDMAVYNTKRLNSPVPKLYESDKDEVVHKQIVNRLLEPFMWHTVIVTATEWDNFFKLRTHPDAQYEIRRIADLMYDAYHAFDDNKTEIVNRIDSAKNWHAIRPQNLKVGEWHCPLVYEEDGELVSQYLYPKEKELGHLSDIELGNHVQEIKKKISVARCARVSYLTHDGKRDIEKDLELFERLRTSGHWSPMEHIASSSTDASERSGNFIGWMQYRQTFPDNNCTFFRK